MKKRRRPPRPRERAAAKAASREAIITAAIEAFAEQGLDGPSLDDICARAGYTRGAFYVQFKDRDDLIVAVTERYGRFQLGVTGTYAFQFAGDKQFGVTVPPDGHRSEVLLLGGIFVMDMPEYAMSMKIKAVTSVIAANAVRSQDLTIGFIRKWD